MLKKFFSIFIKVLLLFIAGAAVGLIFFYFFKDPSVFIIERFKMIQGFFGIQEYQEGISFNYVLLTILIGNLVSTFGYFFLGYLRASLPISFISGFFIIVFLFAGTIRHGTAIPLEVIVLSSIEMLYRIIALSTGEYLGKYRLKNKAIPITTIVLVFLMYAGAAFYEISQIF
jgi:hypothetical protein